MDGNGWFKSSFSTTNGCLEINMDFVKSSFSVENGCLEVAFRKSSRSMSNACLEAAYKMSSYTGNGDCVEAALSDGMVLVCDSKLGEESPVLEFYPAEWEDILDSVRDGTIEWITFQPLEFNEAERRAFVLGVIDGEFDLPKETV